MAASATRTNDEDANVESESEASSIYQSSSVISTVPDRHGFLGGSQYSPERYDKIKTYFYSSTFTEHLI